MMNFIIKKCILFESRSHFIFLTSRFVSSKLPDIDLDYLCDPSRTSEIRDNIHRRKGVGNIDEVINLHKTWMNCNNVAEKDSLKQKLIRAALNLPNKSHPAISLLTDDPLVLKTIGKDRVKAKKSFQFHDISTHLNICRTENISNFTGPRSYYFLDDLVSLEQALIRYTLSCLKKFKFEFLSVPDILPRSVIEYCGMDTRGERNQVYSLDAEKHRDLCLSGTAEMGIAYYLSQRNINPAELPLKFMAVSRCFRAETSKIAEEKGIYRVHQFTKVEMFGVSTPSDSDSLLDLFVDIQEGLFNDLGLSLRTLDMPPAELGAQAMRKFDIEAWLSGRKMWGEISSASNCTDYQSRRLGIKAGGDYVHTVNGTACAIPRLIIALLETHQKDDFSVELPKILKPYMKSNILRPNRAPKLLPFKTRQRFK